MLGYGSWGSKKMYDQNEYNKQYKVFSIKTKHRTTSHNHSDPAWISCKGCIDYWSCQRIERKKKIGCEAKLLEPIKEEVECFTETIY